jgi:hypothetical protein
MTSTDDQLWRTLRVGDRVKIVHFPYEFSKRDYTMHDETRAAYRHLIETKEELCVRHIDDEGYPWVKFTIRADDGEEEFHSLMLNHDGIVLVEKA